MEGAYYNIGADSRIRTDDLIITNDLLCQLSYIGVLLFPLFSPRWPSRSHSRVGRPTSSRRR